MVIISPRLVASFSLSISILIAIPGHSAARDQPPKAQEEGRRDVLSIKPTVEDPGSPKVVVTTVAGATGQAGFADGKGPSVRLFDPHGVAADGKGNLFICEAGNHVIRKISSTGEITLLAGKPGESGSQDGKGQGARFYRPNSIAVDRQGNIYVADYGNHTIRKVLPNGTVVTLAGEAHVSGSADGLGTHARFYHPHGVAVDGEGNIYVADSHNHVVRKVTPQGMVSTFAGTTGSPGEVDGDRSTARFNMPYGVAVDSARSVYTVDMSGNTVRKITPNGKVSTLAGRAGPPGFVDKAGDAARFWSPRGVAVDAHGNVFVADTHNCAVRKITPDGTVTTLAGKSGSPGGEDGPGETSRFNYLHGVGVDSVGNIYVADSENQAIRKISIAK